jgi:DNA-binding FadR family transcriptional regulator
MLVGKEATIVANDTYAEALRVTSNALYNISHDKNNKLNSEYRAFANAVKDQQYEDAKATILAMLPKMDNYINQYQQKNNKVDFSKVSETLKNLE